MFKVLRDDKIVLSPHIKVGIMTAIRSDGFVHKRRYVLRYAVGFAAIIILTTGGTVFASQTTSPGNILYPIKRTSEMFYVSVQPNAQARAAFQEQMISRRFDEADTIAGNTDSNEQIEIELVNDAAQTSDEWVIEQERAFDLQVVSAN